jgi:hypothetical protein
MGPICQPQEIGRQQRSGCWLTTPSVPRHAVCRSGFEPARAGGSLPDGVTLRISPSKVWLPLCRCWLKPQMAASRTQQGTSVSILPQKRTKRKSDKMYDFLDPPADGRRAYGGVMSVGESGEHGSAGSDLRRCQLPSTSRYARMASEGRLPRESRRHGAGALNRVD